jgi:hypothetical protein
VCGGLQNGVELGETEPSVCSESGMIGTAGGSDGRNVLEEVLHMQQDQVHLAIALPADKAADKVCYVCNFVVLIGVQVCTVACAFWQCVVLCFVCCLA